MLDVGNADAGAGANSASPGIGRSDGMTTNAKERWSIEVAAREDTLGCNKVLEIVLGRGVQLNDLWQGEYQQIPFL